MNLREKIIDLIWENDKNPNRGNCADSILAAIRAELPKKASVDELKETMGPAYNDLSVQVAYKEGFNKAIEAMEDRLK